MKKSHKKHNHDHTVDNIPCTCCGKRHSWFNKSVTCSCCGKYDNMPEEWEHLSDIDKGYLVDGYLCETCWKEKEKETYYGNGMAEMDGII